MTSKENNYSFSHAPCLSPFKLSLSHHLLTWNGIKYSTKKGCRGIPFIFSLRAHILTCNGIKTDTARQCNLLRRMCYR
ncbi:MAG: hypothetical protein CMP20_05065 [Rickettsiales bacterium]|nr:hypothetical protein [Rickettsiales bacterium]